MKRPALRPFLALALLNLTGCGDDGTGSGGGGGATSTTASATTTAASTGSGSSTASAGTGGEGGQTGVELTEAEREAMATFHREFCDAIARCDTLSFEVLFGEVDGCVALLGEIDAAALFAPGSNETAETLAECAGAIEDLDCAEFQRYQLLGVQPEGCLVPGDRQAGDTCAVFSQCASYRCSAPIGGCGECLVPRAEGETCIALPCEAGLVCLGGSCRRLGELGDACVQGPCVPWLACLDGTCAARLEDGDACDPLEPYACGPASACNQVTALCEAVGLGAEDDPCGLLDDGSTAACVHGLRCKTQDEGGARCVPAVARGEACDDSGHIFGGPCEGVDACVDGRCVGPTVATCDP
jgi:hypothetical protein